ncbi:hypothetical protein CTAYLR_008656 [Chrysophaeum taylorii]|uniref:Pyruvate, phosphate dikinase n=1 Tax=Chrysophaeum taylorii TaxID=2483200 RepID=A0AAD7U651_9STRA|nr:hypothetical protein CTAYLR_008656 [Chrysophaeum taylorii]
MRATVLTVSVLSASSFSLAPAQHRRPPLKASVLDEPAKSTPALDPDGGVAVTDEEVARKFVYDFGEGKTDGNGTQRALLGGKGANLAECSLIGLPVPPGFTISTEVCTYYYAHDGTYPLSLDVDVKASVARIEGAVGKRFGDASDPLLVSVRSGARDSMPGMMDTVLNLGLNDESVEGLAAKTGNERFALDCYRRFIAMYGDVVMGVQQRHENEHEPFDAVMDQLKAERHKREDLDLTPDDLRELITRFKALITERSGEEFPQDPYEQLWGAIGAVFRSWGNDRARIYRAKYHIPAEWGTAVNVQAMVFGNLGDTSATGVCFTRRPTDGENVMYGEYLVNAQGEDVVAGIRTPKAIDEMKTEMPDSYTELEHIRGVLERHFADVQDVEFTIQEKKLYLLQTRNAKRTGLAAIRTAYEMVKEGIIDDKTAVKRIPADSISSLLAPTFSADALERETPLATGLPAGPGAASGHITFTALGAEAIQREGRKAILCRIETTPEDLRGMIAAEGILTSRGGVSSHAALVARQMGKVCVCGADVTIDYSRGTLGIGTTVLREGDFVSIDGTTGHIYAGRVDAAPSEVNQVLNGKLDPDESYTYRIFQTVMGWADKYRKLAVRINADTPKQAATGLKLGAEGIGLARTEHMFFEGDRIHYMRKLILAAEDSERRRAANKLLPFQRDDFHEMFNAMDGLPITIRLLDPPLHEFLPHESSARLALADKISVPFEKITERVAALQEMNPMLGHRGCRLAISFPEIAEMQARAIFEAAAQVVAEGGQVALEIMVPFVGFKAELDNQVNTLHEVAREVMAYRKVSFEYKVGTMIELPRAALTADDIAHTAEFFSFGTNDLTQCTMGMSRDDSGAFLPTYTAKEIISQNPFASIDQVGVGQLVQIACDKGATVRPDIKLGVCGEHGGDPKSIEFFHRVGLNYVSCSAPRIPVARLAAAQAALADEERH